MAFGAVALGAVVACFAEDPSEVPEVTAEASSAAPAERPAGAPEGAPPVLLAEATDFGTELRVVGEREPRARVTHPGGATVRGAVDGATVWLAAPVEGTREDGFDFGLYEVDLATGEYGLHHHDLTHAGRPLLGDDGGVWFVDGWAGAPSPGAYRVDGFRLRRRAPDGADEVLHEMEGLMMHLGAVHGGEAFVYRVRGDRADVVAVSATGEVRTVVDDMLPFARDFSVDRERLVYRQRHAGDARRWLVRTVPLAGGEASTLFEGDRFALAPHAWPGGGVALNAGGDGLSLLDATDSLRAPLGAGVDEVRAVDARGRWVALVHREPGGTSTPFLVDRTRDVVVPLPAPGRRFELLGLLEGTR